MSLTFEFCDARAKEAAKEAKEATLENVKERNLVAEKTWRRLAKQAQKVAQDRARTAQEKADKRDAELRADQTERTS